jgi:hypothetical protein
MSLLQGRGQPAAGGQAQVREDAVEVPLILEPGCFGLEEQRNLGSHDRHAASGDHADLVQQPTDPSVTPEDPNGPPCSAPRGTRASWGRRRTPRESRACRDRGAPRPGGRATGSGSRPTVAMTVQAPPGAGPSRAGGRTAPADRRRAWRSRGRRAAASCVPAPGPAPSRPPPTRAAGSRPSPRPPAAWSGQGSPCHAPRTRWPPRGVEPSIGPQLVGRHLEHSVQIHRALHARNRLTMGIGPLEADLGFEPVRVDQQQDKVGPAGIQLVGGRSVLRRREAPDDTLAVHRLGGVGPAAGGPLPVPPSGDAEDDAHRWRSDTVSSRHLARFKMFSR